MLNLTLCIFMIWKINQHMGILMTNLTNLLKRSFLYKKVYVPFAKYVHFAKNVHSLHKMFLIN